MSVSSHHMHAGEGQRSERAYGKGAVSLESIVGSLMLFIGGTFFLLFTIVVDSGILAAVMHPTPLPVESASATSGAGGTGAAGFPFLTAMEIIGPLLIGLALAYGLYRNHTRDRRLDATTEAATRQVYAEAGRDDDRGLS
jgi:hypothetical protein